MSADPAVRRSGGPAHDHLPNQHREDASMDRNKPLRPTPARGVARRAAPPAGAGVHAPDLTVAQFAALKGVATRTVRSWIAHGYVRAVRVGPRLVRIPATELDRIGTPIGRRL